MSKDGAGQSLVEACKAPVQLPCPVPCGCVKHRPDWARAAKNRAARLYRIAKEEVKAASGTEEVQRREQDTEHTDSVDETMGLGLNSARTGSGDGEEACNPEEDCSSVCNAGQETPSSLTIVLHNIRSLDTHNTTPAP